MENSLMLNGIALIIVGAVLAYLRAIPNTIWQFVRSRFTIVIDVTERDTFYGWVMNWLAAQDHFKRCRRLSVSAQRKPSRDESTPSRDKSVPSKEEGSVWEIKVSPAQGEHFFRYGDRFVWMHKDREKLKESDILLGFFESVQFTFLTRDRSIIDAFLNEVKRFNVSDADKSLAIHVNQYASWRLFSLVPPRDIATVVLGGNAMQILSDDIERFFASKSWYCNHAIPYRRGYLLSGPPGNGKSSSVAALASHFQRDVYVLRPAKDLDDSNFMELLIDLPENAFLLIEDVDQIYGEPNKDRLTRSGFLNALDGISATTGRVIFMTTNFPERLDDALIRAGRADVKLSIDPPTDQQALDYLRRFFPDDEARRIISSNGSSCMADLQAEVIARCTAM
jgi:chaperone BCS1